MDSETRKCIVQNSIFISRNQIIIIIIIISSSSSSSSSVSI